MDIDKLKNFCTVVKYGSFTRASEEIYCSQPALSKQVKSIENELGCQLLERKGKTFVLNKNGEIVYKHSLALIEQYAKMKGELADAQRLASKQVMFGATNYIGIYLVSKMLEGYRNKFKRVQVSMTIDFFDNIINMLNYNQISFAFTPESEKIRNDKDLAYEDLLNDELILVTSINDSWANRTYVNAKELEDKLFLVSHSKSATRLYLDEKLKENSINLKNTQNLYSTESIKQGVLSGLGVSILSKLAVINEIELGLLKQIKIKEFDFKRKLLVVYKKSKKLTNTEKEFIEFFIKYGDKG